MHDRLALSCLARRLAPGAILALALFSAGCAGSGWASAIPFALSVLSLLLVGCSESHEPGTPCCVEADADGWGRVSTCHCPAGWACNYAPFADCGGGVCRTGDRTDPGLCEGPPDAGPPDAPARPDVTPAPDAGGDGTWEPCCEAGSDGIGHVSTCFCPAGWECNYGWFTPCGGDTCAFGECPGDAGADDAGADDAGTGAE